MKRKILEVDLAKWIIAYLTDLHWEVFQEVVGYSGRADIVARQSSLVWVIETKTSLGLSVISQANGWRAHAHLVSVGTPHLPGVFTEEVCKRFGIGIIAAYREDQIREVLRPVLNRKPCNIPKLCEEQKTYAEAGTNGGGYFTPFRRTCNNINNLLNSHPEGMPLKDLVAKIDHHYHTNSSARICLRTWISEGKVPGVELLIEKGKCIVLKVVKKCA